MPHKDRKRKLDYLARYRAEHRPSPNVEPQPDPSLPPRGAMRFSEDGTRVQCHACGAWHRSLNAHLKMHGLDAATYKESYDLARTASLLPPVTQSRYREATVARDPDGAIARGFLPPSQPRPKGLMQRLSVRVSASAQRKGVYTRGGQRSVKPDTSG